MASVKIYLTDPRSTNFFVENVRAAAELSNRATDENHWFKKTILKASHNKPKAPNASNIEP